MMRGLYIILLVSLGNFLFAQQWEKYPELEAKPVGGKEQLEQVLQTQLNLSKAILTSNFDEEILVIFDLDTNGSAINLKYSKANINNALRNELSRMFRFLKFQRTQSSQWEKYPYWIIIHLSTDKYNKYYKQKTRFKPKISSADSTYNIFTKADRSPEYYKNGEEGLGEFVLSEIEYPRIAIEKSIEGTVVLEFVVETNGYVTTVNVKQGVNGGCTEEAIRIIKLTRWQPAEIKGKNVRYRTTYPITFSLRNVSRDGTSAPGQ